MNVLLDSNSARVWIDDFAPIVFSKWMIADSKATFSQLCESSLKGIKQIKKRRQKIVYALFDASDMAATPFEMFREQYLTFIVRQFQEGLKFIAIVAPSGSTPGMIKYQCNEDLQAKVDRFDSFSHALQSINKKLESELA